VALTVDSRGEAEEQSRAPEEEEEGRVQGDLFGIFKNLRDLTVNPNSPLF
jgi:hypothetical protein